MVSHPCALLLQLGTSDAPLLLTTLRYDFTVYSQLSATLTAIFFRQGDATAQAMGYWAIWAIGFISRPVGSVLFGHLGDTRGRRPTLLLSILCMSVPSIIIGALPTYQQAGAVAPVLLALMRLVQGLALGGEVRQQKTCQRPASDTTVINSLFIATCWMTMGSSLWVLALW